jgi:hypothetical protein
VQEVLKIYLRENVLVHTIARTMTMLAKYEVYRYVTRVAGGR